MLIIRIFKPEVSETLKQVIQMKDSVGQYYRITVEAAEENISSESKRQKIKFYLYI